MFHLLYYESKVKLITETIKNYGTYGLWFVVKEWELNLCSEGQLAKLGKDCDVNDVLPLCLC